MMICPARLRAGRWIATVPPPHTVSGRLLAALAERLGIEHAADALIDLGERAGAHRPGRKLLTLVHAMLAGGDCIDDADLLRCGQTASVLGHRVMAPSTISTFLRAFTLGTPASLVINNAMTVNGAFEAPAPEPDGTMTIDLDSTVCEVHGYHKDGAAYGHTRTLGYHPLLATRADTGEVLHARQRTGRANTARGTARFVDELAAGGRDPRLPLHRWLLQRAHRGRQPAGQEGQAGRARLP